MDLDLLAHQLDQALSALPDHPLCVGFSGGLDSAVLLHTLARSPQARRRGLSALHIDHRLHADSASWARHCQAQADALDLPLHRVRVELGPLAGKGLEGAAREARYAVFSRHVGRGVLVLAHHRDDQVETVLLRLLRQAGAEAVAGMQPWRPLPPRGWLWRPLLAESRADLLAIAQSAGLAWIEDPSNADRSLDRNFLRHEVLPRLLSRWPQAMAAIAGSAAHLATAAAELHQLSAQRLAAATGLDPRTLRIDRLRDLDRDALGRVIRAWTQQRGLAAPPLTIIERLHRVLAGRSATVSGLHLEWADLRLLGYRDLLFLDVRRAALSMNAQPWDGCAPLPLADGGELALEPAAALPQDWHVCARRGGERLRMPGRSHSSPLQHVLQERGIPPWERAQLPLLWSAQNELLAAGDLVISAPLADWLARHQRRLSWRPPGESWAETPAAR